MEDGIGDFSDAAFFMQFFPMFAILERIGKDMEVRYAFVRTSFRSLWLSRTRFFSKSKKVESMTGSCVSRAGHVPV